MFKYDCPNILSTYSHTGKKRDFLQHTRKIKAISAPPLLSMPSTPPPLYPLLLILTFNKASEANTSFSQTKTCFLNNDILTCYCLLTKKKTVLHEHHLPGFSISRLCISFKDPSRNFHLVLTGSSACGQKRYCLLSKDLNILFDVICFEKVTERCHLLAQNQSNHRHKTLKQSKEKYPPASQHRK